MKASKDAPLPTRRTLIGLWLVVAAWLGALLAIAQTIRDPLDDPDPAYQRPGVLDIGGLPIDAPSLTDDLPTLGRLAVVFFVRPPDVDELCSGLRRGVFDDDVDLVVVTTTARAECPAVVVADQGVIDSYGMRPPRDRGMPEGYAVVDAEGRIRYRTLDPGMARRLDEIATILAAVR